jgi:hypothetical protein
MKIIRIILSPILFFICCTGSLLLGSIPLLMGAVTAIGFSLRPTSFLWDKESKKEEIKGSLLMMILPFIFPFFITWEWIQTGDVDGF